MDSAEQCVWNILLKLEDDLRKELESIDSLSFIPDMNLMISNIGIEFSKVRNAIVDGSESRDV